MDVEQPQAPGVDLDALVEAERLELVDERERHRKRADKFGVDYLDPGNRREFRDEARKERVPQHVGFTTGIDLFTAEEVEKQQQRAERFNITTTGLQWQPPEVAEDEEKRRSRAERFGVDYQAPDETGLMDVDLYESRKEAPPEVERRPDAVHVYGVDLLSTADIMKYFADYGPYFVEWLNDSSANVLFKDPATAKRAIAGLGKSLPPEDLPEGIDAADPANIEYLWHKGEDCTKLTTKVPLIFRMATILDVKPSEKAQSRRLWLATGGGGRRQSGGGGNRGGGRGKNHKVRRSQEGVAHQASRSRLPPGWQHDDRVGAFSVDVGGGGGGDKPVKGRGQKRYNQKRNGQGQGGDSYMMDASYGAKRQHRAPGNQQQHQQQPELMQSAAPMPERNTISYEDL